jgi:hypothetical protein
MTYATIRLYHSVITSLNAIMYTRIRKQTASAGIFDDCNAGDAPSHFVCRIEEHSCVYWHLPQKKPVPTTATAFTESMRSKRRQISVNYKEHQP